MREQKPASWILALLLSTSALSASIVEEYLEVYFHAFPTAATAAGRHDLDRELEDLGREERQDWVRFNRSIGHRLRTALENPSLAVEDRLDYELLLREVDRQLFDYEVLGRPERQPLFWTEILADATVFLLVRDDSPLPDRLSRAAERTEKIPRLASQAREALSSAAPSRLAPEHVALGRRQVLATARFYREGFPAAAGPDEPQLQKRLQSAGASAAQALDALAIFLGELEARATGSPILGQLYAERFRLVTGIDEPVSRILADARRALSAKLEETAAFGRSVWAEYLPDRPPPAEAPELIRSLFERVGSDRAASNEEFLQDYRDLARRSIEFVRQREIMTLPGPLTLQLDRSPPFFVGQSVGGVYPAGPYAPSDAKTLLFLPTPPDEAAREDRDAFYRDFNHHFNVMITPHELVPGHYLQLKHAARHPRKIRALFGDGVYIEGWGTFCERLMLDAGWGGPLDRLAHLKKQMENIARTIVDIRVHTEGMSREEMLRFVQEEALQDRQFATNMWGRAITTSPQLTFYFLGYREVSELFEDVRSAEGERFELKRFMDGMMELGPVPVRHYRHRMLGDSQGSR